MSSNKTPPISAPDSCRGASSSHIARGDLLAKRDQ
jgi:hypothetical protein